MDFIAPTTKHTDRHKLSDWCQTSGIRGLALVVATGTALKANPQGSISFLDRQKIFERLLSLLSRRSKSKCEDEAVCLSAVLGIDRARIYNVGGSPHRMSKFFEAMGVMDPQVLFTSGPRLQGVGYRWRPNHCFQGQMVTIGWLAAVIR